MTGGGRSAAGARWIVIPLLALLLALPARGQPTSETAEPPPDFTSEVQTASAPPPEQLERPTRHGEPTAVRVGMTRLDLFILLSTVMVFLGLAQTVASSSTAIGLTQACVATINKWSRMLCPIVLLGVLLVSFGAFHFKLLNDRTRRTDGIEAAVIDRLRSIFRQPEAAGGLAQVLRQRRLAG